MNSFWNKVNKTKSCWLWSGAKGGRGQHGQIRINGKCYYTHRISWEIHYGEIPLNLNVCHNCDNPICVNPDHLFLGTQSDNMRDMITKNRQVHLKGELNHSKLTTNQVLEIRELGNNNSRRYLANKYNVSKSTIYSVITRKKWAHL